MLLLCVYSAWIVSPELHIDLDTYITYQGTRSGGGHVGRQGFTLVNILLGMENFNPYFASMAGWLFLWLAGVAMGYVLYRFGLKSPVFCAAIGLFVFISPVHEDHFYWYQRLVSLAIGYMLCAASAGLSYYGIFKKKRIPCLLAVLGMIWAFSIYQSFALVYVVLAIAAYLLLFRRWILVEGKENVPFFSAAVKQFLLFVLAYGINAAVTYAFFFNDSGFGDLVMFWGTVPFAQSVRNILYCVKTGLFGGAFYTTGMYGILALCAVIGAVVECWQCREKVKASYRLLYIAALAAMQCVPFLMAVYEGGEPPAHGQMAYPMVVAGNFVFLAGLAIRCGGEEKKERALSPLKAAVAVVAVVLLWNQSQVVMRMNYTDSIRVEEDKNTALEITERIHEASPDSKPVVFIGYYTNTLNPACQRGEYIGTTMLGWDHSLGTHYLNSSQRTVQFINTMGAGLTAVSDPDMVMRARKTAMDMPAWPAPGSVADGGDCVIVKLCEDEWPEEVLKPSRNKTELQSHPATDKISAYIDDMELSDGVLKIKGTVDQPNDSYVSWEPALYMLDTNTGEWYSLITAKMGRPGMYIDGTPSPNSAFMALSPWEGTFDSSGEYMFFFEYRDLGAGEAYWVVPQITAAAPVAVSMGGLPDEQTAEKTDLPVYGGFLRAGATFNTSLELVSNGGAGGYILWGPYTDSIPGTYDITLHYEVEKAPDGAEGVFDVALDAEQIAAAPITAENESVTIEDVAIDGGHRFEVRVYVPDSMVVRVRSIEYERVN